ncbi:hypothetical protein Q5752_002525 [Cryptotrichosporon argae]
MPDNTDALATPASLATPATPATVNEPLVPPPADVAAAPPLADTAAPASPPPDAASAPQATPPTAPTTPKTIHLIALFRGFAAYRGVDGAPAAVPAPHKCHKFLLLHDVPGDPGEFDKRAAGTLAKTLSRALATRGPCRPSLAHFQRGLSSSLPGAYTAAHRAADDAALSSWVLRAAAACAPAGFAVAPMPLGRALELLEGTRRAGRLADDEAHEIMRACVALARRSRRITAGAAEEARGTAGTAGSRGAQAGQA